MQFATTRWFYRYEAYLIVLGILCVAIAVYDLLPATLPVIRWRRAALPQYLAVGALVFLVMHPLADRALGGLLNIRRATTNTYEQKYFMGQFLQRYYTGGRIAVNDVGAANYYADVHSLDLWGIANSRIAQKIAADTYSVDDVVAETQAFGATIAIVYSPLYASLKPNEPDLIPPAWIKVGSWSVIHPLSVGNETQYFYAIDLAQADRLRAELQEFAPQLPDDVEQQFFDSRSIIAIGIAILSCGSLLLMLRRFHVVCLSCFLFSL